MENIKEFYVYLVRCVDESLYCGQTTNLDNRIKEHNDSNSRGSKYTRARRPVVLVYFETHGSLSHALKRENEIKHMSKKKKRILIQSKYNNIST